jgi:type IV pilus assembly protein PilQ
MADVRNRFKNAGQGSILAAVLSAALIAGCSASRPAKVVESAPPARSTSPETAPTETATASASLAEIRSIDLREGAPEVFVDLVASTPLVWTSFRNNDGKVVVELPNALPAAGVSDLAPEAGLVSGVQIQQERGGNRPMTRLLIETRGEVEHSVSADGSNLQIRLAPVERQAAAHGGLVFEPVHSDAVPASGSTAAPLASDPPSAQSVGGGTADAPARGPSIQGTAASRLDGVEAVASADGSVIRISGDGEFPYSTFALREPDRFVIDLQGVMNRSSRSTVSVEGGVVSRVRVAQFKASPNAVARVVFDLRQAVAPRIERTADALVVTFAGGAAGEPVAAMSASSTAMAPAPMAAEQPVAEARRKPVAVEASRPMPARESREPVAPTIAPASLRIDPQPRPVRASTPASSIQVEDAPLQTVAMGSPKGPTGLAAVAARTAGAGKNADGVTFESQAVGEVEQQYYGEPIDLRVTNADITEVLRTFAQLSNLNIVLQPGIRATVTAELVNVPWDQALSQILKINGLGYELEGNVMRIAPTGILRQEAAERQQLEQAKALAVPLRTVMKRLSYADATQVASLLRAGTAGMLSQRGSVIVDNRTNTLIIKELPDFLDAVISVVENLDTPEPQVMIEARIIETTKRFTRTLGVDWGFDGVSSAATGNTSGLIFPNNGTVNGGVNLATGGDNGTLALHLGNVLNTFQLDLALTAAENEGLINILSAPKVATLNNQRASIQSGIQIPIQTIANNTVTVQFVNATLRLDVTPQVTAEGTVLMDIDISKREPLTGFLVAGATGAPISTKDAKTKMVVRDGGTAVIGGIYKVTTDQGENRVPGLANIPILGHLFRNKSRTEDNDELLIFITPRVIKL